MGVGDDDTAASRLGELHRHFRTRPVTGPDGHSYISSEPRPTQTAPAAPLSLAVIDHIHASVQEVVDDTLTVNPHPGPLPDRVEAVYAWYRANTRNADHAQAQRRDTIVYRQQLEHAIAMGDTKVVRPHRCPACRTLGLMWSTELERAVCTHGRCRNDAGLTNCWPLARLAYEHIARQKNHAQVNAT